MTWDPPTPTARSRMDYREWPNWLRVIVWTIVGAAITTIWWLLAN